MKEFYSNYYPEICWTILWMIMFAIVLTVGCAPNCLYQQTTVHQLEQPEGCEQAKANTMKRNLPIGGK